MSEINGIGSALACGTAVLLLGLALPAAPEETEPAVLEDSSSPAEARELELSRTEITGNRELPKVLYIVPWRSADTAEPAGRPVNSLLEEVLAPLDREEFLREVDYYSDLDEASGPAAAGRDTPEGTRDAAARQ